MPVWPSSLSQSGNTVCGSWSCEPVALLSAAASQASAGTRPYRATINCGSGMTASGRPPFPGRTWAANMSYSVTWHLAGSAKRSLLPGPHPAVHPPSPLPLLATPSRFTMAVLRTRVVVEVTSVAVAVQSVLLAAAASADGRARAWPAGGRRSRRQLAPDAGAPARSPDRPLSPPAPPRGGPPTPSISHCRRANAPPSPPPSP